MEEISVHISDKSGLWYTSGDCYARGHAFFEGDLYRPGELVSLLRNTERDDIEEVVAALNGFYSVIVKTDEWASFAVDHVQSVPLFYSQCNEELFVSNDARWILNQIQNAAVDPLLEFEFLLTGVVTGSETLYPEIKQLRAGEYALINGVENEEPITPVRYRQFSYRSRRRASQRSFLSELEGIVERSFQRLLEIADGRQLAISLSGGPDSRLIACMLTKLDYGNLIAFTFGTEGNWDSRIAADVADDLGIPLHVVRYDHEKWFDWFHSDDRVEYYKYAFNFDALPSIGAVPAVGDLKKRGVLEDDSIILCGNAPTQYSYPPALRSAGRFSRRGLVDVIIERYFNYWDWHDPEARNSFRARIRSQLSHRGSMGQLEAIDLYKDWRIRNHNAKLMIVPEEYSFWGIDSWTPLWDAEYLNFWEGIPIHLREDKKLHRALVDRLYDELTGRERPPATHAPRGSLRQIERWTVGSPVEWVLRPLYERFEEVYKRWTRTPPYHRDPVGTFGIMSEAQFDDLCQSYDQDVHPFKTLELLGFVRFTHSENDEKPVEGGVDLDRLQSRPRKATRDSLPWFDVSDHGSPGA